ncbi:MAG TPA: DUF2634 domain-containing protein [Clostridiales bacterium]|nr:DUF2634 domain-containing protein [Clostridiales bacterium]
MLPEELTIIVDEEISSSLTYKIDFKNDKVKSKIDDLEAVKQAVFLVLITEKNYSEIYENYGIKVEDLIGQDFGLVSSELKRRITEALLGDDRIETVNNFTFKQIEDGLLTTLNIVSIFGEFTSEGVYNI